MGRAPRCDDSAAAAGSLKKGPWTPEEDQKLVEYIKRHGHGSWRALPKLAGLNRCGKSCRLRWTNYLRPDIKRGNFSDDEEQLIIDLHQVLGNKWSAIAANLPGRTDNEVKNFWNTHLKKKLLQMGVDPVTHRPRTDHDHLMSQLLAGSFPGLQQLLAAFANCNYTHSSLSSDLLMTAMVNNHYIPASALAAATSMSTAAADSNHHTLLMSRLQQQLQSPSSLPLVADDASRQALIMKLKLLLHDYLLIFQHQPLGAVLPSFGLLSNKSSSSTQQEHSNPCSFLLDENLQCCYHHHKYADRDHKQESVGPTASGLVNLDDIHEDSPALPRRPPHHNHLLMSAHQPLETTSSAASASDTSFLANFRNHIPSLVSAEASPGPSNQDSHQQLTVVSSRPTSHIDEFIVDGEEIMKKNTNATRTLASKEKHPAATSSISNTTYDGWRDLMGDDDAAGDSYWKDFIN